MSSAGAHRDYLTLRSYLAPCSEPVASDVILCFGSVDERVPRRAARLWRDQVAPWIVVTGGGRHTHRQVEADAFADAMLAEGVDPDRIVIERMAAHTGENVSFGLAAAAERCGPVATVTVVAHAHAVRRCLATIAVRAQGVVAHPDPLVRRETGPVSSAVVAGAIAELERLRAYPILGYTAPQPEPAAVTAAASRLENHLADRVIVPSAGGRVLLGGDRG